MDYPEHDTTENWNRIMAESRFSRLPKYSISQRFYISFPDLGQSVYNFDLDKTFTTAIGDRKSIAIRNIQFDIQDNYKNFIFLNSMKADTTQKYYINGMEQTFDADRTIWTKDSATTSFEIRSHYELLRVFYKFISELIKEFVAKDGFEANDLISSYNIDTKNSTITLNLKYITCDSSMFGSCFDVYIKACDKGKNEYLFGDNNQIWVQANIVNDDANSCCTITYDFSNDIKTYIHTFSSVCSTLNPYSQQNIIGSLTEQHDMLNKLFPYDRQNTFQLWFNDEEGNRIKNDRVTGFLDLELIVDNSNNINLDV